MKLKILFCIAFSILLIGFSSASLTTNLTSYWNMNNLLDSTGNGHTLTNYGVSFITGKIGNAGLFTTNNHLDTSATDFNFADKEFSINFWVNTTDKTQSYLGTMVSVEVGWQVYNVNDAYKYIGWYNDGGANFGSSAYITNDTWQMITIVGNTTNISIWKNGVYVGAKQRTTINAGDSILKIGGNSTGGTTPAFNGSFDELAIWTKSLTQAEILQLYNSGGGLNYYDIAYPEGYTLLNSPTNNTLMLNPYFNCSVQTVGQTLRNISVVVDGVIRYTKTVSGVNKTDFSTTINGLTYQQHNWTCVAYNTSSYAFWGNENRTINLTNAIVNSVSYDSEISETEFNNININITKDVYLTISSFKLIYNSTIYSLPFYLTNTQVISKNFTVPLIDDLNLSFYYIINFTDGSSFTTNFYYQKINKITFGLCNLTLNQSYINFTFIDETNMTNINASVPYSNFTFWIGDGSIIKSLIFINNSYNPNYNFCFFPSNKQINLLLTLQYQGNGYPQRRSSETLILTNSTYNKNLYLLNTANGQYVTFSVINAGQQTLSNVFVNATRIIGSTLVLIGNGYTDSAGSITFFLNQNYAHTFNFLKSGYESLSQTIIPTQNIYTIKLAITGTTSQDYRQGVSISTKPTNNFLYNNTMYNFNMTISSSVYSLDEFGFSLYYDNGTLISTQTSTLSTGGTLNVNGYTSNNSRIYMNYYYISNGTYFNGTSYWIIQSTGNKYSIFHFFTDLNLYLSAGIFGIDDFGKSLIAFCILVLISGFTIRRYGIQNEVSILGIIFGVILFLDTTGFLPEPSFNGITPIPHLIPIITGILFIGFFVKEEMR